MSRFSAARRLAPPAALLALHAVLGLWAIRAYSATFDEPELIGAGYSYWVKRDMRLDPKHPPLALLLDALPLLARPVAFPDGPQWRGGFGSAFGERLLFWSGNDGDELVQLARLAPLLMSLLVGAALWLACRRAWGERWAGLALAFYCFSPSLLAHSALATTDLAVAGFCTLAFLSFGRFLREPTRTAAVAAGLWSAAAVLCKSTGLLLGPAFLVALAADGNVRRNWPARRGRLALTYGVLPGLAVCAMVLALCPSVRAGFAYQLRYAREGAPVFLFGRVYPEGARWFYVAAVLVKSTLPELVVAALAAALLWRRRLRVVPEALCAAAVLAVFFVAASLSHKQLGIRYLLPCYCALAVLAAPVGEALARRRKGALAALLLAVWQAASAAGAAPDFLPYFNEAAGGAANGHVWLSDSNLDWGQDLKRLGAYVEADGRPEVILSYFGTASPERYGLRPQQLLSHNNIQRRWMDSERPARELLVVSRTNLQGVYLHPSPFGWLEERAPDGVVGRTLLVYDVTSDADAHRRLAEIYDRLGDSVLAAHERRRAANAAAAGR